MHYQVIKWEFREYGDSANIGWVPTFLASFSDKQEAHAYRKICEANMALTYPTFEWRIGVTEQAEDESYKYARS